MSEKETNIGTVGGNFTSNEAKGDITQAGRDANQIGTQNNYYTGSPSSDKPYSQPISGELTYFLDRKEHRRLLRHAIQNHHDFKVPLVCIVYGEKENCGKDIFVSTIQPAISDDHPYGIFYKDAVHKPIGNKNPQNATHLHDGIKAELKEKFEPKGEKPVSESIQNLKAPVVIDTALSTSDYVRYGAENLIHGFLAFWQQWQAAPQQDYPILICLFIHLEPYKMTWLDRVRGKKDPNVTIKETLANLNFEHLGLHGVVLPEVGGISQEDIDEWASDFQILEKFGIGIHQGLKNEIEKCYAQQAEMTLSKMSYFIYKHLSNPQSRNLT
ncbi:MAG: hypothetical protein PHU06_04630 [Gallionella sp.]|nr:hypothetical protein [Gallionella sp.]MDD4960257.1 hypothetical protein [Gallionella sp.]